MDRKERILKEVSKSLEPLVTKRVEAISNRLHSDKAAMLALIGDNINLLIEKAIQKQQEKSLEAVKYICFEFLLSSIITKSYDFQISIYDKDYHIKRNSVEVCFTICEIFEDIDSDLLCLKQRAEKEMFRIMDYELEDIRKAYVTLVHYKLLAIFMTENIKEILNRSHLERIDVLYPLEIYHGWYMDKIIQIDSITNRDNI